MNLLKNTLKMNIEKIITSMLIAAVLYFTYQNLTSNTATKEDLDEVKKELKAQIDSVLQNCDTLKADVKAIKANTDTLRAGQEVIFQSMKENANKEGLLTKILKLWKK